MKPSESCAPSVTDVLLIRNPLKILWSVVGLDAVDVIDVKARLVTCYKGKRDQAVNINGVPPTLTRMVDGNAQISTRADVCAVLSRRKFSRPSTPPSVEQRRHPLDGSHPTVSGNLDMRKAGNIVPFVHDSMVTH